MSNSLVLLYRESFNKEEQKILWVSFIILMALTSVIFLQKFIQFGSYPDYQPLKSILFNFLIVVPFILCVMIALKLPPLAGALKKPKNIVYYIGIGVLNFLGYIVLTNLVLYLLNFSSSIISGNFFWKYLTGIVQVHLTLYLFVHFYRYKTSQRTDNPKFVEAAKGSVTYTVEINDISWVESYDHYVKLHTPDGVFLKRDTMKGILSELGNDFVRIHRKFIVNQRFVKRTEKKEGKTFIVVNDKKLKVSNSYLQKVSHMLNSTV